MSVGENPLRDRFIAYGKKEDIPAAIRLGKIPKGCIIYTSDDPDKAEEYFYDHQGVLKTVSGGVPDSVVKMITAGGKELPCDGGIVNIPQATAAELGLVKSDSGVNKISVLEDGTMSVGDISINNLTQSEDDILIFNSGGAEA